MRAGGFRAGRTYRSRLLFPDGHDPEGLVADIKFVGQPCRLHAGPGALVLAHGSVGAEAPDGDNGMPADEAQEAARGQETDDGEPVSGGFIDGHAASPRSDLG